MSHDDFAFEPSPGLPAPLPKGEQLLWQGSPRWQSLALDAYYVRIVAIYFAGLVLWRVGVGLSEGHSVSAIALSCVWIAALGATAAGILALLAYFSARMTIYTITSERVLLRHGIAVPLTLNVPFSVLEAADLRMRRDGTGDVSLRVDPLQRIAYLVNWPHLRAGSVTRPQPSFRSLLDAETAARVLGEAMSAHTGPGGLRVAAAASASPLASTRPRRAAAA
jgi:hypothetical protein